MTYVPNPAWEAAAARHRARVATEQAQRRTEFPLVFEAMKLLPKPALAGLEVPWYAQGEKEGGDPARSFAADRARSVPYYPMPKEEK